MGNDFSVSHDRFSSPAPPKSSSRNTVGGLATSMCPLALFLSLPLTPLIINSQISDLRSSARDSERNCNHLQSSMLTTTVMEAILISSILHRICHRRADVPLSVSPLFIREYAIIMDKAFMRRWKVEGGRWTMERNDTLAPQSPPRASKDL